MSDQKPYTITITSLPHSEIEIKGSLSVDRVTKARKKAIKNLAGTLDLDGFRKGNIPENILIKHIGEIGILQEAAHTALSEEYGSIISEAKAQVIGQPQVTFTKLVEKAPVEFTIVSAIVPDVTLPEYIKIAEKVSKEKKEVTVDDKEVEDTITQIRKNVATQEKASQQNETPLLDTEGNEIPPSSKDTEIKDEDLPELTDEFVKKLGSFKDVADFTQKLKENILQQKELKAQDERRVKIMEGLIEQSTIDVPNILVEGEISKMLAQLKEDVTKTGLNYEDYLNHIKKTEDDIKKEWRGNAEKRAKTQLILNKIAVEEKITPDEKILEHQLEEIAKMYPDADKERARIYVETTLINEQVFQLLEGRETSKKDTEEVK